MKIKFVITSITVALFFSAAALCQQTNASKQTAKKLDWENSTVINISTVNEWCRPMKSGRRDCQSRG